MKIQENERPLYKSLKKAFRKRGLSRKEAKQAAKVKIILLRNVS